MPLPPSTEAALAGATRAAQPLRQPDHRRPRRRPPAAGPLRSPRAAWPPTSTPRPAPGSPAPTCRGTARRWSTSSASCWPRPSASPTARAAAVADVDLLRLRQERLRTGTFDDNRRTWQDRTGRRHVPHRPLHPRPAAARHRPPAARRPLPLRPGRPPAAGPGLLRGLQHPGLGAGAAADGDRPAQDRHRRLRRPRLDPRADRRGQGDGPAGPAAQRHPRLHHARVRDQRWHQGQRHPPRRRRSGRRSPSSTSGPPPASCWPTWTTRSPAASPSTT